MTVIDASLVMALLYQHEAGHTASRRWFGQALVAGEALAAPVIMLAEVAAAMSQGKGDRMRSQQFIRLMGEGEAVLLYPVTLALARRAAEIAADYKIRGCDAVYVALAEQLGQELVTLDQEQLARGADVVRTARP